MGTTLCLLCLLCLLCVIVNVPVEQVDDKDEEDASAPPLHPRGQPEAGAKATSCEGGVHSAQTPRSFAAAAVGEQSIDQHDPTLWAGPATRDSRRGTQADDQATGEGHREEAKQQAYECMPVGPEAAAAASRPLSQTRDVGTMPKSPDSIESGGEGDRDARAGLLRAEWLGAHHGSPPQVKSDTDRGVPEVGATEVGCGSATRRLASAQRHEEACRTRDAGAGDAAPARAHQLFETPLSALGATRQPTVKMPPQLGGGGRRARGSAVQANPKRKGTGKVLGAQGAKASAKSGGGLKLERQETAQLSSILSWRTFLVPAAAAAVGYCVYGPRTAAACAIFPVFFVLTVAAFQDSETCVQACALGLAVGTVVGAAGTQRHDKLVLAGVALLLLILMLLAPLTTEEWASFAQLTGALAVGAIGSAAWVLPPEETVALVAILVPAYLCGLAGGVHAGMSPPSLFFPNSAALGALAVLVGAWGACHDLPMHPDLWMTGAY